MSTSAAVAIPVIANAAKAAMGFMRVKNAIMKGGAPMKGDSFLTIWGEHCIVPHDHGRRPSGVATAPGKRPSMTQGSASSVLNKFLVSGMISIGELLDPGWGTISCGECGSEVPGEEICGSPRLLAA